ncbi:hypothetical protein FJZ19_04100 [Candidatus Pacearchaeota archaeon]|nr:hypothetical protein [Candidatus Pacearchaeota archaeon]
MPARNVRIVRVDELQPSQHIIRRKELERIAQENNSEMPEVWDVNDVLVIADGHHRIYQAYQQGKRKIKVLYHSARNCLLKGVYEYLTEEMRKQAEMCREAGFFHVSDLIIQ